MACREFRFNEPRTLKDLLGRWTVEEILDALITYRRDSEPKDRLHELVGKISLAMVETCQRLEAERDAKEKA
jgi:hypothetical protein